MAEIEALVHLSVWCPSSLNRYAFALPIKVETDDHDTLQHLGEAIALSMGQATHFYTETVDD